MKGYRASNVIVSFNGTSVKKTIVAIIAAFIFIFAVSGLLTSLKPEYRITFSAVNEFSKRFSGESLLFIFGYENAYFTQNMSSDIKKPNYGAALFELTTSLNLDDPRSLIRSEIPGFRQFDSEILIAGDGTNYTDISIESPPPYEVLIGEREAAIVNLDDIEPDKEDNEATPPPLSTGDKKVVYIYNSHNYESFLPYLEGVTNPNLAQHSKVNVMRLGERLKDELQVRGVGAQFETEDIMAMLKGRRWEYPNSYKASRIVKEAAIQENRELSYFIDIHRDGARKDVTTTEINGEKYAKIMFVIGTNHKDWEQNLKIVEQLDALLKEKYPGISRGARRQGGAGNNGVYNQDLSDQSILIEIGGVDNTFEEMYRTVEAFADVFSEFYWQAEKVDAKPEGSAQ